MEKKQIVGYCRVSTLEQKKKGYGIDIQIRDIRRYADIHGIGIEGFYIDEAKSGVSEDRHELRRLIKDCKAGKIKAIIIASLDRLSRDLRFTENLFYEMDSIGVKILIADMPGYDSANRRDVLIRQIREAIAEENRKEIIERLKKGREERIRKGKPPGGNLSYGYMRNSKNIRPNPKEVEIIKVIFSLKKEGKSDQDIADVLNQQGHRRRNGQSWTQRQIWAILSREELYSKGVIRYGEVIGRNEKLIIL